MSQAKERHADFVSMNDCPHIDEVEALNPADEKCLEEIATILKKHNKLDRFGVTLLHKHFSVEGDEVLVEMTDEGKRIQTITAQKKEDLQNACLKQTAWRFKIGMRQPTLGCYQTCVYRDGVWNSAHVYAGN